MLKFLKQTFQQNLEPVFHHFHHQDATVYAKAIHHQNSFLSDSHVIPTHGISEDLMYQLDNKMLQVQGVYSVLVTKHSISKLMECHDDHS